MVLILKKESESRQNADKGGFFTRMQAMCVNSPMIEIYGDNELLMTGCKGIVDYGTDRVVADTALGILSIAGKRLELSVFRGDVLSVCGTIESITFGGGV